MLPEKTAKNILFTIQQIDNELSASEPLLLLADYGTLDHIHALAGAAIIHAFYTGIESIFLLIYKHHYGKIPETGRWHNTLLSEINKIETPHPILNRQQIDTLKDYLAFRHRFRHAYTMNLDHELITEKLRDIPALWDQVKIQILEHIK